MMQGMNCECRSVTSKLDKECSLFISVLRTLNIKHFSISLFEIIIAFEESGVGGREGLCAKGDKK